MSVTVRALARDELLSDPTLYQVKPGKIGEVLDHLEGELSIKGGRIEHYTGGSLKSAVEGLRLRGDVSHLFQNSHKPGKPTIPVTLPKTLEEIKRQLDRANGVRDEDLLNKYKIKWEKTT